MTDQLTDNEVIARFDGREEGYDEHGVWQKLRYNSDWRDLMPVWYKFRDLKFTTASAAGAYHRGLRSRIRIAITDQNISESYKELVEAVKWYNSIKK
jgi:hypothetical protein